MNPISLTKKRLLFITYGFPPNAEAGTHRSFRFVRYLKKLNWDVVVLTADPKDYIPGTPVDLQYLKRLPSDLEVIHSRVFRGFVKAIRFKNFLKTMISGSQTKTEDSSAPPNKEQQASSRFQIFKDLISIPFTIPDNHVGWFWGSVLHGWLAMRSGSFDLIYSSGPPWTSHLIAHTLSRFCNVPWVADFRDPWARSPWRLNRNKPHKLMAEYLEKKVIHQAKFIILNTDWTRREFRHFYENIASEKFQWIPNGYEPEDFDVVKQPTSSGEDRFKLVHAGSIYGGRDPVPLLKAWALFLQRATSHKAPLLLSLVGITGKKSDEINKIVLQLGLGQHVELVPRVSHQEAIRIMVEADLLLLLQGGLSLCVPAKLFEYMALGKPILGLTPAGATADILKLYPLGRIVSPDDPDEILDGLCSFFDERKNVFPREQIDEFIARYRALDLTKELDQLLNRAMSQKS